MELIAESVKDKFPGTIINIVLDESSSMSSRQNETISAYNEYLKKQQESPEAQRDDQVFWSLTRFSDTVRVDYAAKPIKEAPLLTKEAYTPSGWTALNDAIGMTIVSINKAIENWENKPNILTVVITDGEENFSKEFSTKNVKELIKQREDAGGWTFVFLGSELSTQEDGANLGFNAMNVMQYDLNSLGSVMNEISDHTTQYISQSMASNAPLRNVSFFGKKEDKNVS